MKFKAYPRTLQYEETPLDLRVFPVFYKKKVLPLDKTEQLKTKAKSLSRQNQFARNEKTMLKNVVDKHEEFVSRLEKRLGKYKEKGVEKVRLTADMVHQPPSGRPDDNTDSEPEEEKAIQRLKEWYPVMEYCVKTREERARQIVEEWFIHLDSVADEGEPDAQAKYVNQCSYDTVSKGSPKDSGESMIFVLYFVVTVICLACVFLSYRPEDVHKCKEDPRECIAKNMLKFADFFHGHYTAFHNITVENPYVATLNSSTNVSKQM